MFESLYSVSDVAPFFISDFATSLNPSAQLVTALLFINDFVRCLNPEQQTLTQGLHFPFLQLVRH
jgi:hypothetical protein